MMIHHVMEKKIDEGHPITDIIINDWNLYYIITVVVQGKRLQLKKITD